MFKILLRKTISSLMLMTLALFLVSFSSFDLNENQYNFNNNINNDSYFPNPAMTQSGVTISTESPFAEGGGSYNFNGNSSFMRFDQSSNWNFGTNNYTVEWFQKQAEENSYPRIIQLGNYSSQTFGVSLESQTFYGWTTGPGIALGSLGVFINTWVHFAMVREGTTLRAYKNGVMLGSSTISESQVVGSSTTALTIGNELTQSLDASFEGLITNLRLVSGVAVYSGNDTVNTNFNIPSKNLTPISGSATNIAAVTSGQTKLLLIPNAPINYLTFTDTILTNDLTISGSNFTPDIVDNQLRILRKINTISTSVFHKTKFDLDNSTKKGFSTYFELNTSSGADGIVFVLTTEVGRGSAGGSMGYLGPQTAFNKSIGFFINPHLGNVNGVYTNKTLFGTTQAFNRLDNMHIFIDYDETSQTLLYEAYSTGDRLLANQIFSRTFNSFNIRTYLDSAGEYYVGFTGGTGAANMDASIAKWSFYNQSDLSKNVILDPRGGTGGSTSISALTGSAMLAATAPTRTGHTFDGYYSEIDGGGTKYYNTNMSSAINYPLTTDTTLYANWTINPYDITINNNNGSPNIVNSYQFGSPMPTVIEPSRTGYTFNSWSPTLPTNVPAADTTYTAQWTAVTNTITLINNNGSANTSTPATYDSTLENVSVPLKTGHTFNGYYANEDFTGDPIYNQSGVSTLVWNQIVDINLYAKWTINPYNITINNNLGSSITSVQNYGTKVSTPTPPTAPGLTFLGWYKDNNLTLEYDFDAEIDSNLSIFAKWGLLENGEVNFDQDFEIANSSVNFVNGSIRFSNSLTNVFNTFAIASSLNVYDVGNISVEANSIFIGIGSERKKLIGTIDSTDNGMTGKDLLITFPLPTAGFTNGNFNEPTYQASESLDFTNNISNKITNWTVYKDRFPYITTSFRQRGSIEMYKVSRVPITHNGILSNFMLLEVDGIVDSSSAAIKNSAFGPYIISGTFFANPNDKISFDWKAIGGEDHYHVKAYLLKGDISESSNRIELPLSNAQNQDISRGASQASIVNTTVSLTPYNIQSTDPLRFMFVGGSYDASGGGWLGSDFYIGNVGVQEQETLGDSVEKIIRNITFSNQNNNPILTNTNNLTLTTITSSNTTNTYNRAINIIPVNDAPTRSGTLTLTATQNQAISINFGQYFTDPDSTLTFSASNLPSNLSLSSAGVLTGTLSNSNVGNNLITITASDGVAAPVSAEYTLAVANVNDAPIVNNNLTLSNYEIEVGLQANNTFTLPSDMFIDIDNGDQLTYSVTGLPSGLTFNSSTRTVSGSVASNLTLPVNVTIKATDTGGLFATRVFVIDKLNLKIKFLDNNGNVIDQIVQNAGTQISLSTNAPIGYEVIGWYEDAELNVEYTSTLMPNEIIEVYGKFSPIIYSISYRNLLNGSNNSLNPSIYSIETPDITLSNPARTGYVFSGWFDTFNYSNPEIIQVVLGSYGNKELFAKWTPIEYSINYVNVDNDAFNNPTKYTIESSLSITEPQFKTGHYFGGFFYDAGFGGERIAAINPGDTGNKTLHGLWIPNLYKLRFSDDKGLLLAEYDLTYETPIDKELIPNTEKEGYTFEAWSNTIPTTMPAAPLNFIAKFKVNQYQLLIKNGFDNSSQTFVVDFDSKLEDLVKQPEDIIGYKFDKWSIEVPETMPANDLELTAEFIPLEFKLLIKDSIGNIVLDKLVPFDEDLSSIIMDPPTIAGFEFESKVGTIPDKMPNEDLEIIFNYVEVFEYRLLIVGINEEILLDRLIRENESLSSIILPNLGGNPGFDFTGWDNQLPETMPSSDLIIKATGNLRLASLSLYDENGTLINIFEGMVGSSVNLPNPVRIGYNFAGWLTQNNQVVNINVMPNGNNILRASWTPKIYTILVTVGSNDFNISLKFGEPIGNIVSPQLFGFRFEGWKNNLTGEFLNSNTIFTTPEEINLIPVFTRLNAAETLVAATRLISDFLLRLFR